MVEFQCAVGRKVYSIRCREDDAEKIKELAAQLNKIINRNALKYRGLSGDNLFLITSLELLDQLNLISDNKMSNANCEDTQQDFIRDAVISRHFAQILSDITDRINSIADEFEKSTSSNKSRDIQEMTVSLFPIELG